MSQLPPIIILAFEFPPESEIGGWRPYRFAKYLSELGHRVEVICAGEPRENREDFRVHRIAAASTNRIVRHAHLLSELALRRLAVHDFGAYWMLKVRGVARRVLTSCGPGSIILSTSPPVYTHMLAASLRRDFDCRWLADFRDPLFGNLVRQKALWKGFDERLERRVFEHADLVIANTEHLKTSWEERYPQQAAKIRVLENGFDPADFGDAAVLPSRDLTLIAHVGNVYGSRDPRRLFRIVDRLITDGRIAASAFRFLFYGEMSGFILEDESFLKLKARGCLEHRDTAPQKEESEAIMRSSEVLFVIGFASELQVPAKLYFYIRTGRPILASFPTGSAAESILAQSGIPYRCIHPEDTDEQMAEAVLGILALPRSAYEPSDWFLSRFDAQQQSRALSRWTLELEEGSR